MPDRSFKKAMLQLLKKRISKIPNYYRAFGLWHGMRLLKQIEGEFDGTSQAVRAFTVPGYEAPIQLRDSTSDHAIFWEVMVMRQYGLEGFSQTARLQAVYEQMVRDNRRPLIVDCGGNIGLSAVWFAQQFPKATIYVIEPDGNNFDILTKNVAPFGNRIHSLRGGVWCQSGALRIMNPEAGSANFRVNLVDRSGPNTIRAYTIDEIFELADSQEALIVKLDIEGSQKAVFAANTGWVGRSHLIALELDDWLYPWECTSQPFFACVSHYPFDYLISGQTIFCFHDMNVAFGAVKSPARAGGLVPPPLPGTVNPLPAIGCGERELRNSDSKIATRA